MKQTLVNTTVGIHVHINVDIDKAETDIKLFQMAQYIYSIRKIFNFGLQIFASKTRQIYQSKECLLPLQRMEILLPASIWQFTNMCNSRSRRSNIPLMSPQVLRTQVAYKNICRKNNHENSGKIKKSLKTNFNFQYIQMYEKLYLQLHV